MTAQQIAAWLCDSAGCEALGNHSDCKLVHAVQKIEKERDAALLQNRALYSLLLARRTMEPKHSRADHECNECIVLANMKGLLWSTSTWGRITR